MPISDRMLNEHWSFWLGLRDGTVVYCTGASNEGDYLELHGWEIQTPTNVRGQVRTSTLPTYGERPMRIVEESIVWLVETSS